MSNKINKLHLPNFIDKKSEEWLVDITFKSKKSQKLRLVIGKSDLPKLAKLIFCVFFQLYVI